VELFDELAHLGAARVFDCNLHSRIAFSRVFTPLTGSHCKLRPNTAGGFTYEIVSIGSAAEISQRGTTSTTVASTGVGVEEEVALSSYTADAHEMMECQCVRIFGQGMVRVLTEIQAR
jgi:hypothetical protein